MALSSDQLIKDEIQCTFGDNVGDLQLRIFPEGSSDDQRLFTDGGLTFSCDGVDYGSCDACWYIEIDGKEVPCIGLEGTDCLNRKSSGNAQYQRFHHALGAVKNGLIGVYYLKKGIDKIQPDLFGMALFASKHEKGVYLVIDDIEDLRPVLVNYHNPEKLQKAIDDILAKMKVIFNEKFRSAYHSDWARFAIKRSTVIYNDRIIKYAGRMRRNFTDGSQRAGHIAVGEMYLTKYYFYGKKICYLLLKMTKEDVDYLDKHKKDDKEWHLLRNEPDVEIKTIDDLDAIDSKKDNLKVVIEKLKLIKNEPIKGDIMKIYKECVKFIDNGLRDNTVILL